MLLRSRLPFPLVSQEPSSHARKQGSSSSGSSRFTGNELRPSYIKVVSEVRFDGPFVDVKELKEINDGDLVVETCITRTLPPALTLERGLQSIKEAVEEVKVKPPSCSSGILRFQVAIPPGAKALSWFCSQPKSSVAYPLFFLSKEKDDSTSKSIHLNRTRGTFGIGAAISFTKFSSFDHEEKQLIKRYLSNGSVLLSTYGFMDISFNAESSSIKHEDDSFYFFVPLIELDEHADMSILIATLAWNDSGFCTIEQAIHCYESVLCQVSSYLFLTKEQLGSNCITSALRKLDVLEEKALKMAAMSGFSLDRMDLLASPTELRRASFWDQFVFRFSPTAGVACNMLDHSSEMRNSIQHSSNINAVWASLIIEECSRLGLTYFCIAPGSRSSPLALAATAHPLITSVSCFDERSLAFHAVGYGRGSHKPAVVITSSGTAVSNLFPAVVEASQDLVPLLLLTADRPPELHDVGANQAVNQVNHFGSYVRFFFNFPAPTDHIPARMALTTIDSAVHWATSSPNGPVHINCPFREPLDHTPDKWEPRCLKKLDIWRSTTDPFTKYIAVRGSSINLNYMNDQMLEVLEIIRKVNKGLLLIGAINNEDDIWATLLLAKHLQWPVAADILSGLRLRKLLPVSETEDNILFLDFLDHILLSDSVRDLMQFDGIIQIGSRITSKRVSHMLEERCPSAYIMVDNHPRRHDPSHLVTHRIQSSITEFSEMVLKSLLPHRSKKWCNFLQVLNSVVAMEISTQLCAQHSLSEPYVAHIISEALPPGSALFLGNSMVIRDLDMYGGSWENSNLLAETLLASELPWNGIQVAGNRGASGIDGLLSTAVGFAVGCNKRVLSLMGDISFLHDTNGLAILKQRYCRQPMKVIVINNHGGAIFSLLPVAEHTAPEVLDRFFYTTHSISIQKLSSAHSLKHLVVRTKAELQDALFTTECEETDCIIEVESSIDANLSFHRNLRNLACQAADHAVSFLSKLSFTQSTSEQCFLGRIGKMAYSLYRIQLCAPTTSSSVKHELTKFYREGFILSLTLEDGSVGYGEVAPLEISQENLLDVKEQLQFLLQAADGARLDYLLPFLKGSFSSWIRSQLGIPASSLFPSVRCGLEMAVLNALAVSQSCSLLSLLHPPTITEKVAEISRVRVCALIDGDGSPDEIAEIACGLVKDGYCAIKLKVARKADPVEDAAVVHEVRKRIGALIELRVDANRKWTYDKATLFASLVKNCNLQYIEEPVEDVDDLIKYCDESGLSVALDETIDNCPEDPLDLLTKFTHSRIVALVIKPTIIGGFEKAARIARWAQGQGKMAVVSAAFESSLALSAYIEFSSYLDLQNMDLCKIFKCQPAPAVAHGLGTYRWLKEDVTPVSLGISCYPDTNIVEASVRSANHLLQNFQINHRIIHGLYTRKEAVRYQVALGSNKLSYSINALELGQKSEGSVILFLHGFLGSCEEWLPIMEPISVSARCISIDLPGHGDTKFLSHDHGSAVDTTTLSIETVADLVYRFIQHSVPGKVTIVGYSMGARIALYMALKFVDKMEGAVIISGSPGLIDTVERKIRKAKDESNARALVAYGLDYFLNTWYAGDLWRSLLAACQGFIYPHIIYTSASNSLRSHPHFHEIFARRMQHQDVQSLGKVMSDLSIGRQPPLWEDLEQCNTPLSIVFGEKDLKFKAIGHKMFGKIALGETNGGVASNKLHELVEVPNSGHAVHLENPLAVIRSIRLFATRLRKNFQTDGGAR